MNPIQTGGTPLNSNRTQVFYLNAGMNRIGHVYSLNDLIPFTTASVTSFLSDFSVSHHDSILVSGGTVNQNGFTDAVPNGRISSTDNIGTPTPIPPVPPEIDVTNEVDANRDFHFEGGLIKMLIPTVFLPPIEPDVVPPAPPAPPVAVQNIVVPPLVLVSSVEVAETPFSSYSTQSQDYFQLREFDGVTRKVVENYEHIADEFGELLLQPARLKQWVTDENFQDRIGLELWLITEKHTKEGTVTVERPVLKFDIANGQPFPAKETMPTEFEELELKPMPLDHNFNGPTLDEIDGVDAPNDDQSSSNDVNLDGSENIAPDTNPQALVVPLRVENGTVESNNEVYSTFSSSPVRAMLTTIAVAAVLNKNPVSAVPPSKSRQLLNRLLNRQRKGDNL